MRLALIALLDCRSVYSEHDICWSSASARPDEARRGGAAYWLALHARPSLGHRRVPLLQVHAAGHWEVRV